MGKFQGLLIPEFQAPSSQRALKGGSSQVPSSTVPDSGLEQAKFRESGQVPSSGFPELSPYREWKIEVKFSRGTSSSRGGVMKGQNLKFRNYKFQVECGKDHHSDGGMTIH